MNHETTQLLEQILPVEDTRERLWIVVYLAETMKLQGNTDPAESAKSALKHFDREFSRMSEPSEPDVIESKIPDYAILGLPPFDDFIATAKTSADGLVGCLHHQNIAGNLLLVTYSNDHYQLRFKITDANSVELKKLSGTHNKQFFRTLFNRLADAQWRPELVDDIALAREYAQNYVDAFERHR